jgi:hypothetical protein
MTETGRAVRFVLGRRDGQTVAAVVGTAYLLGYLFALGDLRPSGPGTGIVVAADPLVRALTRTGPTTFDAVALVDLGPTRLLVSPLNLLLGGFLAALVGLNLGLSYLAWRRPAACGIDARGRRGLGGVVAAVPALLSGTVCCGPVVLLLVGIQATGALVTAFAWLLPAGVLALLGSLWLVARGLNPPAETTEPERPAGERGDRRTG